MTARAIKFLSGLALAFTLLLDANSNAFAQRNAHEIKPTPMKRPPLDPNAACWHTIRVEPKPGLPEIHFYDKLNPVWWFGNADDPIPPDWYKPDDAHRKTKWFFRNPLHNLNFYVIGVADKNFHRSGYFPDRNSDPQGGWDFEVTRRRIVFLPFVSYDRNWCTFYFGWRERGNFGIKLSFHGQSKPEPAPEAVPILPPENPPSKPEEKAGAN